MSYMKRNNRGFTLIEILAAVTILAIISGIAVISVNRYTISTKKKLYQNMERSVCDAAKNYVITESLEDEVKDSLEKGITYEAKDLMRSKYLEDLVDPNNKAQNCRANVNVKLSSKANDAEGVTEYVYFVKLRCKGYESNTGFSGGCATSKKVTDPGSPEPSEDVDNPTNPDIDTTKKPTCEIIKDNQDAEWTTGPIEAEIRCIDHSTKGCKQEFYTKTFEDDGKLGYIEMEDNAGNKAKCKVNVYIDNNAPTKPKLNSVYLDKWTNKSFSIEIDTYDMGSGLAYIEYRYPNSTSAGEKEWKKYENSAKESGVKTKFLTPKFSKERAEKVEFRACDNIGNCSDIVSTNIKIDKTAPSCTMTKNVTSPDGLNDWYKTALKIDMNRKDPVGASDRAVASPISYGMVTKNTATYNNKTSVTQGDTTGVTWYGFIKDEAGNTATCGIEKVKVDSTKPTKPNITNPSNGNWTSKAFALTIDTYDAMSGLAYISYRYPNSKVSSERSWKQYANSAKAANDKTVFKTTNFSKERSENVEIISCDEAGNCSDISSTSIKIDKTAPTCTVTKSIANPNGTNGWYKNNLTITLNITDSKSNNDTAVNSNIQYGLTTANSATYNGTRSTIQSNTNGVTWYGFVKDDAGNTVTCNSGSMKIDTTIPTVTFELSGETAVVKCSDTYSGLATANGKTQSLTGTSNVTVNYTCTDKAGNTNNASKVYKYNSCKSTKNTCKYGCDPYDSCYTGSPSVCVGGYYDCNCSSCYTGSSSECVGGYESYNCSNCKTGSSRECVGGYVNGSCKEYNKVSKWCGGKGRSSCKSTSGCNWTGGGNAHCTGYYKVNGSCKTYNRVYSRCATTKNTCKYGCDTRWNSCKTTKNTCQYGCSSCYDSCKTTKNTCQGGQYCSDCYTGSRNQCVGGFQLN